MAEFRASIELNRLWEYLYFHTFTTGWPDLTWVWTTSYTHRATSFSLLEWTGCLYSEGPFGEGGKIRSRLYCSPFSTSGSTFASSFVLGFIIYCRSIVGIRPFSHSRSSLPNARLPPPASGLLGWKIEFFPSNRYPANMIPSSFRIYSDRWILWEDLLVIENIHGLNRALQDEFSTFAAACTYFLPKVPQLPAGYGLGLWWKNRIFAQFMLPFTFIESTLRAVIIPIANIGSEVIRLISLLIKYWYVHIVF